MSVQEESSFVLDTPELTPAMNMDTTSTHPPPHMTVYWMPPPESLQEESAEELGNVVEEDVSLEEACNNTCGALQRSNLFVLAFKEPLVPTMDLMPTPLSILRHLECPICFDSCVGKRIYTCIAGHAVCDTCYKVLSDCPTCRSEFVGGRAFGLESLANDVTMYCKYRVKGCSLILKGSPWRDHLESCDYRPIVCQALKLSDLQVCGYQSLSYQDFVNHIAAKEHNARGFVPNSLLDETTITVPLNIHHIKTSGTHAAHVICSVLVDNDNHYVMNARYFASHKTLAIWVAYVGRPSHGTDKAFELAIHHTSQPELSVTYKVPIRSAHKTAEEVEKDGFMAYVSRKLAESYAGKNHVLLCEFRIVKV